MNRVAAVFLVLALGLGAQECERCGGVLGCTGEQRVSLGGQLIVHATGKAVPGAALDFVRTGGVPLAHDSVSTTTDAGGRFQLAVDASAPGEVVGALVVRPPAPWLPYRVPGLTFRTSDVRGEGQVLGRLVVDPYIDFLGLLKNRVDGQPLAGARVTIKRTGGVAISPPDSFDFTSYSNGVINFLVGASAPGDMIADMVVESPALPRPVHRTGVTFTATYQDRLTETSAVFTIGDWLPYVGVLYRRGSQSRSAGIEVEFQRTGGIPAAPDTFVVRTDAAGYFPLVTTPLADGELVGNLIVRPPAPEVAETIFAVRMPTIDAEQLVLRGVWGYGYALNYGSAMYRRGTFVPAPPGLVVQFRRTGGVAITPDSIVVQTNADGWFPLSAAAAGAGNVIGDLTVRLPAPQKPDTLVGVRIPTFASDEQRFLLRWGYGYAVNYASAMYLRATFAPAPPGLVVQFRRTGGVAITPDSFVVQTNADGWFPLSAAAADTGTVVGDLTVRLPAPFTPDTLVGVQLPAFDSDEQRFLLRWNVGPSLQYVGRLLTAGTDDPIADAEVDFQRTGGIGVTPALLVTRSLASGFFLLNPAPLDTGEVVGTLTIRPPAPFRDTTFAGIRLQTFNDDSQRLAGAWRLAPPP